MNILTDILSLLKRKKYVEVAKPDDVLVIGIHEEPDILGIASPIPYKDAKLIKIKDLVATAECTHINIPEVDDETAPAFAGVYKNTTTVDDECYINLRRLKSLSLDLTIVENGDFIDFDLNIDSILDIANVLTVTKSGNDTTAAVSKYDFHKPWANPTVAMAAASGGDVVVVYPGTYTIGDLKDVTDDGNQQMVRSGVTLYMMPGAIIWYGNFIGTISLPFTDGGDYHKFKVRGKGKFIFDADISTGVSNFLVTTNASTVVDIECDSIHMKRTWGGTGHKCRKWRMVGTIYTQRESAIINFPFPAESENIKIDIDFEEVTVYSQNSSYLEWTRQYISNLSTGSLVNIRYGTVTYPNAIVGGAFHEIETCDENSTVNLTIDNITRTGTEDPFDYIVYHNGDNSKGIYNIKNINTHKGLIKSNAASTTISYRTAYLHGNVYTNPEPVYAYLMEFIATDIHYKIHLDIIHTGVGEYDLGIYAEDSGKVKISGYLSWISTNNPIVLTGTAPTISLTLIDFVISCLPTNYFVSNLAPATTANLAVMNVWASKISEPMGPTGVTLIIGTVTVNVAI